MELLRYFRVAVVLVLTTLITAEGRVAGLHQNIVARHARRAAGLSRYGVSAGATLRVRVDSHKTAPSFDMDPATFTSTVENIPTDILLLFYSPTCPDCERLMPLWTRFSAELESRQDLTVLSVSDPEGLAVGGYHHTENPAVFFIRREQKDDPVPFSSTEMHAFIDPEETPATDAAIYNELREFTRTYATSGAVVAPAAPQKKVAPTRHPKRAPIGSVSEAALNAKFLAILKARQNEPVGAQLEATQFENFRDLPVAQFLKEEVPISEDSAKAVPPEPLVTIAAQFLDGEPLARRFAAQYATWYLGVSGEVFTDAAERSRREAAVVESVLPAYLRNVYTETKSNSQR